VCVCGGGGGRELLREFKERKDIKGLSPVPGTLGKHAPNNSYYKALLVSVLGLWCNMNLITWFKVQLHLHADVSRQVRSDGLVRKTHCETQ
jgi:hypothetical protein